MKVLKVGMNIKLNRDLNILEKNQEEILMDGQDGEEKDYRCNNSVKK